MLLLVVVAEREERHCPTRDSIEAAEAVPLLALGEGGCRATLLVCNHNDTYNNPASQSDCMLRIVISSQWTGDPTIPDT